MGLFRALFQTVGLTAGAIKATANVTSEVLNSVSEELDKFNTATARRTQLKQSYKPYIDLIRATERQNNVLNDTYTIVARLEREKQKDREQFTTTNERFFPDNVVDAAIGNILKHAFFVDLGPTMQFLQKELVSALQRQTTTDHEFIEEKVYDLKQAKREQDRLVAKFKDLNLPNGPSYRQSTAESTNASVEECFEANLKAETVEHVCTNQQKLYVLALEEIKLEEEAERQGLDISLKCDDIIHPNPYYVRMKKRKQFQ